MRINIELDQEEIPTYRHSNDRTSPCRMPGCWIRLGRTLGRTMISGEPTEGQRSDARSERYLVAVAASTGSGKARRLGTNTGDAMVIPTVQAARREAENLMVVGGSVKELRKSSRRGGGHRLEIDWRRREREEGIPSTSNARPPDVSYIHTHPRPEGGKARTRLHLTTRVRTFMADKRGGESTADVPLTHERYRVARRACGCGEGAPGTVAGCRLSCRLVPSVARVGSVHGLCGLKRRESQVKCLRIDGLKRHLVLRT